MAEDLAALTLLGDSADWLKDQKGVSIRDHRLAALEAYRAAWGAPASNRRLTALQQAFGRLFDALRQNQLYPEAVLLGRSSDKNVRYLAAPENLRKELDLLRNFCVVNKFGMGEAHLLYFVLMLCRSLYQPAPALYDRPLEDAIADVLFLRLPIYRADNLGAFSFEAKARFHAVRIMRSMKTLGLFDETMVLTISAQDQAEAREVLASDLAAEAGRYIQKKHRLAFQVFDTTSALEEYALAHIAGRAPIGDRTPEELFLRLRHRLRHLPGRQELGPTLQSRIMNLGIAGIVRSAAHVDPTLGREMYAFLRSGKSKPTVRHARMFEVLSNNAERLRFLNFLYLHGKQNPVYYVGRFERFFPGEKLRFVNKDVGFTLGSSGEGPSSLATE